MDERFFITGAARGLGLAMTRQLLSRGCRIGAFVRRESEGLAQLRARHADQLRVYLGDVTDDGSLREAFSDVAERFGQLDVLVNNAVTYLEGSRPTIEGVDLSICARTFEVNSVGPLRVVQHALPLIRKGSRKLIVNISSEAGSVGASRRTAEYAYCMSKSALNMGSKLLSNHLAPEGIQVLALHPGWFNSSGSGPAPISAEEASLEVLETMLKARVAGEPMYVDPSGKPLPW